MYGPSARRAPDLLRTVTAHNVTFLTAPPGVACFTDATITSPMFADPVHEPPRTLLVKDFLFALSATFKRVSVLNHFSFLPFQVLIR